MIWESLVSETIKDYWKKIGFEPSDGLKAAIIYDSPLTEGDADAAYLEILKDMKDETVAAEIRQVMECREKAYRGFIEDAEDHIYGLKIYEEPGQEEPFEFGYFTRQEYAYHYAMEHIKEYDIKENFIIEKTEICTKDIKDKDDYNGRSEKVIYTYEGKVKSYYLSDGVLDYDEDCKRFYDRFYDIPYPFKRGDVVKIMPIYAGLDKPAGDPEKDYYFVIDAKKGHWQNEETGEYTDIGIKIEEFNANTGRFYEVDACTNPIRLEYVDYDKDNYRSDDPAYMVLHYMTSILSGKEEYCSLQTVQDACRCLRERHEEENKIKCFLARFEVRRPYFEWYHT